MMACASLEQFFPGCEPDVNRMLKTLQKCVIKVLLTCYKCVINAFLILTALLNTRDNCALAAVDCKTCRAVVCTLGSASPCVLMKPSGGDLADIRGDLLLITKPSAMLIESYVEPLG